MNRCEAFWVVCDRRVEKIIEFENVFHERQRLRLCRDHLDYYIAHRQELLDAALETLSVVRQSGMTRKVTEMVRHPAQLALIAHQESCDRCSSVRDWILVEQQAGRIRGPEDMMRIGQYVVDHACEEGIRLNEAVGKAMQGG